MTGQDAEAAEGDRHKPHGRHELPRLEGTRVHFDDADPPEAVLAVL